MNGIKEKKLNIWSVSTFVILALAILFIIYPLVLILYKSVISGSGNLSFAYFTKFFQKKYYWSTLINSFKVTIVATAIFGKLAPVFQADAVVTRRDVTV